MKEHPKCQYCKSIRSRCIYELFSGYCKYKKKPTDEGITEIDIEQEKKEKHIDQVKDLMQHEQREDDQQAFDLLSDQQDHQPDHDQPQEPNKEDDDLREF